MKPLAYFHDYKRGLFRILVSKTGNKLDAVWVDVSEAEYKAYMERKT